MREQGERASHLGWTNQMPELMMSHHLVISKAGGATVQEAIAARCPMIVNQVIPGQEEGNAELIEETGRRRGRGEKTRGPANWWRRPSPSAPPLVRMARKSEQSQPARRRAAHRRTHPRRRRAIRRKRPAPQAVRSRQGAARNGTRPARSPPSRPQCCSAISTSTPIIPTAN